MPYTSPAAQTSGSVAPVSWATSVKAALDYLANPPACRVYHNAAQSIPDNTTTTLVFNSERYDTDTMHSTVSNTSRITFTNAGVYLVTLNFSFAGGTALTWAQGRIRLNGATLLGLTDVPGAPASFSQSISVATTYKFAAGDYVEALAYQDNVPNVAVNVSASGNYSPEFAATWIGLG